VTSSTGRQMAIEIQYSPLTPDEWASRHASYQRLSIIDVWLFGHNGRHLRATRNGEPGEVDLSPMLEAIAAAGVPLLWINPITEEIGTAWATGHAHDGSYWDRRIRYNDGVDNEQEWRVPASRYTGRFVPDPLADCSLTDRGLQTPNLATLRTAAAELATVNARRDAIDKQAQREIEREEARKRRQRRDADPEGSATWLETLKARDAQAWLDSELHAELITRWGEVPRHIACGDPVRGVFAHPAHWHAVLFKHLVLARTPGQTCR
jgi:hypothetical protein